MFFCLIVDGKIPSYKIGENEEAIAVLEINPLSRGHSLIIPKIHVSKHQIPEKAMELANEIARKLRVLKPKQVDIKINEVLGHGDIEVIPIYGDEKERKKATEKELKELQDEILNISVEEKKKDEKKESVEVVELPPYIP